MDLTPSPPKLLRLSAPQRQELERLFLACPRPSSSLLEEFIKDRPLLAPLDTQHLKLWFHSRRLKEKRDEKLSPLINKNAELVSEHQSLLLRNSQLRDQTLLLNLENQRLKQQLELQLQQEGSGSSSASPSSAVARGSRNSCVSDDEEVSQLANNLSTVRLRDQS